MTTVLTQSRFNMWRAVIAMIHADDIVKPHEINFILKNIQNLSLSAEQRKILHSDIAAPMSIEGAFGSITHPADRKDFFHLARAVSWADGHFDDKEQALLVRLKRLNADLTEVDTSVADFAAYAEADPDGLGRRDPALFGIIKSLIGRAA